MMTCRVCGLAEDEHHTVVSQMPVGCRCDPGTWCVDKVCPPCASFVASVGATSYCRTCLHDAACHAESAP